MQGIRTSNQQSQVSRPSSRFSNQKQQQQGYYNQPQFQQYREPKKNKEIRDNSQQSKKTTDSTQSASVASEDEYDSGAFDFGKYKTKLCRHWKSGYCLFGPSCVFAHGVDDLCEPNLLMNQMNNLVLLPYNLSGYMPPMYGQPGEAGLPEGINMNVNGSLSTTGSHVSVPIPMSLPFMSLMPSPYTQMGVPPTNYSQQQQQQSGGIRYSDPFYTSNMFYGLIPSNYSYIQPSANVQSQQPTLSAGNTATTTTPTPVSSTKTNAATSPSLSGKSTSSSSSSIRSSSKKQPPKEICTLCYEVLGNQKVLLPCMHEFHAECFNKSEQNILNQGCPHCLSSTSTSKSSGNSSNLKNKDTLASSIDATYHVQPLEVSAE